LGLDTGNPHASLHAGFLLAPEPIKNSVAANDLSTAVLNNMAEWLLPGSVHTSPQGAAGLGQRVASAVETALTTRKQSRQK